MNNINIMGNKKNVEGEYFMEIAQEVTSGMNFDFSMILVFFNLAINFAIKVLLIYIMYLSICALKKYLNDK